VVRMAGPTASPGGACAFQADMPRAVPLARWDADSAALQKNGVRFSGFLDGASLVIRNKTGLLLNNEKCTPMVR